MLMTKNDKESLCNQTHSYHDLMCAYQRTIAHACPNAGVEKHDYLIKGFTCPTQGKG